MEIRIIYFKVDDIEKAVAFWQAFLEKKALVLGNYEFWFPNLKFVLVKKDFRDEFIGSNCVPVFEVSNPEVVKYVKRAKELGAKIIEVAFDTHELASVLFTDPVGNEFTVCKYHG